MVIKKLAVVGSKRFRAIAIAGAAIKTLLAGNKLRALAMLGVAFLAWKSLLVAAVAGIALAALRGNDEDVEEIVDDLGQSIEQ